MRCDALKSHKQGAGEGQFCTGNKYHRNTSGRDRQASLFIRTTTPRLRDKAATGAVAFSSLNSWRLFPIRHYLERGSPSSRSPAPRGQLWSASSRTIANKDKCADHLWPRQQLIDPPSAEQATNAGQSRGTSCWDTALLIGQGRSCKYILTCCDRKQNPYCRRWLVGGGRFEDECETIF